jgi:hypothetical protein
LGSRVHFLASSSCSPSIFIKFSGLIHRSNSRPSFEIRIAFFGRRCSGTVLDQAKFLFCSRTNTPMPSLRCIRVQKATTNATSTQPQLLLQALVISDILSCCSCSMRAIKENPSVLRRTDPQE